MNLQFITTNELKMMRAKQVMSRFNIDITQNSLEFDELQSYDGEKIARHKAEQAFAAVGQPIVVTDDTWTIPGLHDFPGPYMKAMNHYLQSSDWERLVEPLTDRRIFLHEHLVYQDADGQYYVTRAIERQLLPKARGSHNFNHLALVAYGNDGRSRAEALAGGDILADPDHTAWHDLGQWLTAKQ